MPEGVREKIQVHVCLSKVLETDGLDTMEVVISDTKLELTTVMEVLKVVVELLRQAIKFEYSFLDYKVHEKRK